MKHVNKICLISQDFFPMSGGIASYLLGIYHKYFSDSDFNVIVPDSMADIEKLNNLPFKVYKANFSPFNFKDSKREESNKKIIDILDLIKPSVILFGYIRSHPEAGLTYRKLNPNTTIAIFTYAKEIFLDDCIVEKTSLLESHKGYRPEEVDFYKSILSNVDFVFAVSEFTKKILLNQNIKANIIVLNPTIKKMDILPKESARAKLGIYEEAVVLLSVGRLIKRKGQKKVIEIIPNLINKYPNLEYIIVGNGPEFDCLQGTINSLNIRDKVKIFTSASDTELSLFYSACDVFVLPCEFILPNDVEGWGIVFSEASSFGKPCVGGNSGGIPEAVIDKFTGLLVNPTSKENLLHNLEFILSNKEIREKLGKNGIYNTAMQFDNIKSDYLIKLFNL